MGKTGLTPIASRSNLLASRHSTSAAPGPCGPSAAPFRSLSRGPDLPWRIAPVEGFEMFAIKAIYPEEFPSPRSAPADWGNLPLPLGARPAGAVQLRHSGINGERGMGECKK